MLYLCCVDWCIICVDIVDYLWFGFLMGFQVFIIVIGMFMVQVVLNMFGVDVVVVYMMVLCVDSFVVVLFFLFGFVVFMYVVQNYGGWCFDCICCGVVEVIWMVIVVVIVFGGLFIVFGVLMV